MALEFIRVLTLVLGSFALGLTITVLALYVRLHRLGRPDGAYRVPLIGAAHALLICAIDAEILQHVVQREPFEWWLTPFAVSGFILSIWALTEMLRSPQLRRVAADVEAHRLR